MTLTMRVRWLRYRLALRVMHPLDRHATNRGLGLAILLELLADIYTRMTNKLNETDGGNQ